MQKKFISNLILLLFLNLLVKPAWIFGIDLPVQNRVGAEEYGLYFALFNFSMLFNILLDLGLTHYNNQAVSRNRPEVVRNFSNLTSLKFMLGVVYLVVTLVAGFVFGYSQTALILLLILSFNQFLASLILFFRSNLSGMQFFRADSLLSVVDKTLMIVLCGILLFGLEDVLEFNVVYYALAQSLSYIIASVIAFFLVWKKVRVFTWRINFGSYGKGLRKSIPYALLILLMSLYTRVDGIMVERLVGSYESGIYAASFRLLDMVNQLGYLFGVLLLPMFSAMLGRKEDVSNLTRLSFNLVFTVLLGVSLVAGFNASPIMDKLYQVDDPSVAHVFELLISSSIGFGTTFIFGTLLTAAGKLKTLNTIALVGFVLNIILNFILIPDYGAEGAAIATVFTQLLAALAQVFYSFRLLQISFPASYVLRLSAFVLVSVGTVYLLQYLPLPVLTNIILSFGLVMSFALFLKLFNYQTAIDLMKSRLN
ncbi:MAG TPA: hypothetical protein DCG19_15115 [Cryomorphaceae bacterium]|nr:hypothetical protein [Cryomorphaceae bacterium]